MSFEVVGLFVIVTIFLAVGSILFNSAGERARQTAYSAYAQEHNFQYVAARDDARKQYEQWMPLFRHGHARQWRHQVSGSIERRAFAAFEYRYSEYAAGGRAGGMSRARYAAVIRWDLPGANLPAFTVGPTGFFDRIREDILESSDVLSLGDPDLPRALTVKGDPDKVSPLLSDAVREAMQAWPNQHLAALGDALFWWCDGSLPAPQDLDPFLSQGDAVRAVVEAAFRPV